LKRGVKGMNERFVDLNQKEKVLEERFEDSFKNENLEKKNPLKTEKEEIIGDSPGDIKNQEISQKGSDIDFILDIPLQISVELGRTRMTVQDLLQLGHGSIVELNKLAGETVDVLVNERLIARGEVVRINEKLGVRITDIVTLRERIEKLG
jgi:flagellar motor switch protein FliN/FliY